MKRTHINRKQHTHQKPGRLIRSLVGAGLVATALPVLAQSVADFEAVEPSDPSGMVRLGVGHQFETDIDDGGEFSETALRLTGAGLFPLNDQFKLGLVGSYQFSHYDFSDLSPDPWDDIHLFRLSPLVYYAVDEQWTVYGGPTVGVAAESGADFGDAFTGGMLAGFNYRHDDTLSLGAGFGISSQIEDDVRFLPFITANWQFAEKWNLRGGFSEVAGNSGLGAEVTYSLGEKWKLGGGIQFRQKRFRLDDDDGVGQDRSVPMYVRLTWQVCPKGSLEFLAGFTVGGNLRVEDSSGHKIGEDDYDPAALIGARAVFSF